MWAWIKNIAAAMPNAIFFFVVALIVVGVSFFWGENITRVFEYLTDLYNTFLTDHHNMFLTDRHNMFLTDHHNMVFISLALALIFGVPGVMVVVLRFYYGDYQKVNIRLKYFAITLSIALGILILKLLLWDPNPALQNAIFPNNDPSIGIKELFGYVTTLYAFVAGFLLLFALQEFSTVSREFRDEIDSWHNLYNLLKFFLADSERSHIDELTDQEKSNDREVRLCFGKMRGLEEAEDHSDRKPKEVLNSVYNHILKLKICDDNDQVALASIIEQYCGLRIFLRQRDVRKIRSPSMLVFQLWLVGAGVIFFSALSLNNYFTPDYFSRPIGRLLFTTLMALLVAPLTVINLTIADIKNPFSGDWRIHVHEGYADLSEMLKGKIH